MKKKWKDNIMILTGIISIATGIVLMINKCGISLRYNPNQVISNTESSIKKTMTAQADDNSSNKNPTSISEDKIAKPDQYPNWVQYYGPWANLFGGTAGNQAGTAQWGPRNTDNVGCVATALAIQMARGGVKKAGNGEDFNPKTNQESNGCTVPWNPQTKTGNGPSGLTSYKTGDKGTVTRDPKIGDSNGDNVFGDDSHTISDSEALKECKKIADSGNYPLLRVNGDQHTVAFWKGDGNKPLYYDPARGYQGATVKQINYVGAMEKGQLGAFSYDSPAPNGGSAGSKTNSNSSSSGDSSGSSDSSGEAQMGGADIKPIFNPFRTPVLKEKTSDNIDGDDTMSRAEKLQVADGIGAKCLTILRDLMVVMIYLYVALITIGALIKISDYYLGGMITDFMGGHMSSDSFTSKLFMPQGEILGIGGFYPKEIVLSAIKKFTPILLVLLLTASGMISKIIAWCITGVCHMFPHMFNF